MSIACDLVLQHHDRIDHHFWAWRTSRNIDIHRDDPVDALHDGIVAIETAAGRARAEGHDPLRLAHLVVDLLQYRRGLVTHGADHHEQVGLPGRKTRQRRAEAVGVIKRGAHRHELHPAAGGDERIGEETELADPSDQLVLLGRHVLHHCHSRAPSFQRYTKASASTPMKKRNDTSDTAASSGRPAEPAQMNSSTVSRSNSKK